MPTKPAVPTSSVCCACATTRSGERRLTGALNAGLKAAHHSTDAHISGGVLVFSERHPRHQRHQTIPSLKPAPATGRT